MQSALVTALIALQAFVVMFIALHDWIQLGSLNDVKAVQAADSRDRLVWVTVYSTAPFAFGLAGSVAYAARGFPELAEHLSRCQLRLCGLWHGARLVGSLPDLERAGARAAV